MNRLKIPLITLITTLILAFPAAAVHADDQNPNPNAVDPNSVWGQVVDQNGNILYDQMKNLGVVQQTVDWMPNIPLVGSLPATYQEYQTKSGNIVVMPTASTLFFMALNPQESGFGQTESLSLAAASDITNSANFVKSLVQGYVDNSSMNLVMSANNYTSQDQFFSDVIDGKQNIWSVLGPNTKGFLISLIGQSLANNSIYTALLLYTPDQCSHVPGGCPTAADIASYLPPVTPPPSCTTPVIQQGAIIVTAQKLAPNYPFVVGQDPSKRGVDMTWKVQVAPTTYSYGVKVPVMGKVCVALSGTGSSNCTTADGQSGTYQQGIASWKCEKHTKIYTETLNWATASASLSSSSRDWIINTLSLLYPEAYLHHPYFGFGGGTSGFQGNTFVWTLTEKNVQVADPGYFNLVVAGYTSGTPVSSGRGFSTTGGTFEVWVVETTIIQ